MKLLSELHQKPVYASDRVSEARKRHGKPFAWESGSNWAPRAVPVLTAWLQSRGKDVKK